jgi:hypothetical protein
MEFFIYFFETSLIMFTSLIKACCRLSLGCSLERPESGSNLNRVTSMTAAKTIPGLQWRLNGQHTSLLFQWVLSLIPAVAINFKTVMWQQICQC